MLILSVGVLKTLSPDWWSNTLRGSLGGYFDTHIASMEELW